MSILSSWLKRISGGNNPADSAMPYINQIPGVAHQTYDPYIQQGQDAFGKYNPVISEMSQDPTGYLDKIMQNYEPSRGYQLRRDEELRAMGNTASAGGMRGSMQDMESQARLADSLMGQDMQQWLQNVMGIQGAGLSGQQDIYNKGFTASTGLGNDLEQALAQQANLAFQGSANQNQSANDILSGILKGIGGLAGGFGLLK